VTIWGQDRAVEQFTSAWATRKLHHAWLLAGAKGVGKASFAHAAARRVLADAAGPASNLPGIATADDHPIVKLVEAGSHPDMRQLQRLENERTGNLARNINVGQVRSLSELLDLSPAMSEWRVAVIDSADDLEPSAANALLKMLEEPPAKTLFFLVSHAPGRR
jgi:DNA polymerase-3 subunit delta'